MAFYVKNDTIHELKTIASLTDLNNLGIVTKRIEDTIDQGLEKKLLEHLEDFAPQICENYFPTWSLTQLNNYLLFNVDEWGSWIGLLDKDQIVMAMIEFLHDHRDFRNFSDIARECNFTPNINSLREKLAINGNKKNIEIFDKLIQLDSENIEYIYDKIYKQAENKDKIVNIFLKETLHQFNKRVPQFTYKELEKIDDYVISNDI